MHSQRCANIQPPSPPPPRAPLLDGCAPRSERGNARCAAALITDASSQQSSPECKSPGSHFAGGLQSIPFPSTDERHLTLRCRPTLHERVVGPCTPENNSEFQYEFSVDIGCVRCSDSRRSRRERWRATNDTQSTTNTHSSRQTRQTAKAEKKHHHHHNNNSKVSEGLLRQRVGLGVGSRAGECAAA